MTNLPHILIGIVIFALCYLVFIPLMGAISIKDLDDLNTVTSKMKKDRWEFGS